MHAFGDDDPASMMEDDATLDAITRLTLPRYRLADYEDRRASKTDDDKKYLDDIRSGRGNVSGFVRVGLFKRLSSSGHSFILSLQQRQRARNELFMYAIDNKLPLPLGRLHGSPVHRERRRPRGRRASGWIHGEPLSGGPQQRTGEDRGSTPPSSRAPCGMTWRRTTNSSTPC